MHLRSINHQINTTDKYKINNTNNLLLNNFKIKTMNNWFECKVTYEKMMEKRNAEESY